VTSPAAATDHDDGTRTYRAPHHETGEMFEGLPNVTGVIPTPPHIYTWEQKMTLLGVAMREDLQVQVAAGHLLPAGPPRNGELRRLAELAKTAGQVVEKKMVPADRGSGFHALTERLDELVPAGAVSKVDALGLPRRVADVARAYVAAMTGVSCDHREVTVVNFTARFAGTADFLGLRFAEFDAWARAFDAYDLGRGSFVADAKFGEVHDSVALQLAALAMGETIYDAETNTHTPLPTDLRRDIGFAFHPDKGLVPVDLTGAADAFLGALAVKHYQVKGLAPLQPPLGPRSAGEVTAPAGGAGPGGVGRPGASGPPPTAPTHVAVPLAAVVAAIPANPEFDVDPEERPATGEPLTQATGYLCGGPGGCVPITAAVALADVFAGLPDEDGRPQIDRAAKRAWLIDRLKVLEGLPGGLDHAARHWPVIDGVPVATFSETAEHTADQLAAIEVAIDTAEDAVHAPFPETDDPTAGRGHVPNDDRRVLELVARITALPADLQDLVSAGAQQARIPNLGYGGLTEAHLADLEPLVAGVEPQAAQRAEAIAAATFAAEERGVHLNVLLGALGGLSRATQLHGDRLVSFHELVDAVGLGVIVERNRALVVDQPALVLDQHGGPGKVLEAARRIAKARGWAPPTSSTAALDDPLMAAALAAT
jgi:hypothetical protein